MAILLADFPHNPLVVVGVILVAFWILSGVINGMQKAAKEAENRQRAMRRSETASDIRSHGGVHRPSAEIQRELRSSMQSGVPTYLAGPQMSDAQIRQQQAYQQAQQQEQLRQQQLRHQQIAQQQARAAQLQREQALRAQAQREHAQREAARAQQPQFQAQSQAQAEAQQRARAAAMRQAQAVLAAQRLAQMSSTAPSVAGGMERSADVSRPRIPGAYIATEIAETEGVRGVPESTAAQFQGGLNLLITPQTLRNQFILTELLGAPLALRQAYNFGALPPPAHEAPDVTVQTP